MRKTKVIATIALTALVSLLCTAKSMAKTATVSTDTLNLREKASTSSEILKQLDNGQKLEVIEEDGDWIKVKVSGTTGYVSAEYVKISGNENTKTNETKNTETSATPENTTIENNTTETTTNTEVNTTSETVTNTENTNIKNEEISNTEKTSTTEKEEVATIREATINKTSNVNILPLINATKIGEISANTKIIVMDEVTNWYYIQTDTISGWILKSSATVEGKAQTAEAQTTTEEQTKNEENKTENTEKQEETSTSTKTEETNEFTAKTMYVNYSSIYVREKPTTSSSDLGGLVYNDEVKVIGEEDDWYKVEFDGKTGYVAKRLLSDKKQTTTSRSADERDDEEIEETSNNAEPSSLGEEIVAYAKQYLGCKYVYGASGPSTFDCSGFSMYVYKHFGINLSHSATAQSKVGTKVSKENLQPGDLVFFTDYETGVGIGHVGIYIGGGDFIHASSGTGYCVKISTLLSGSYLTRYETARRVI